MHDNPGYVASDDRRAELAQSMVNENLKRPARLGSCPVSLAGKGAGVFVALPKRYVGSRLEANWGVVIHGVSKSLQVPTGCRWCHEHIRVGRIALGKVSQGNIQQSTRI